VKYFYFDIIWIVFTSILLITILYPIKASLGGNYPFYASNALFIFLTLVGIHFIFFLEYSIIRRTVWIKVAIIFLIPFLLIFIIDKYFLFIEFNNLAGLKSIMTHLGHGEQLQMEKYIRSVTVFFGVGAIISSIAVIFRMIISIWRQFNTNRI